MFFPCKYLTVGCRLKPTSFHFRTLVCKATHFLCNFRSPLHQTLHSLLEKCASMKELQLIHAQIILNGLSDQILTLGRLISFCAVSELGSIQYAQLAFDQIPEPNKFMYNSLIRGYANSDDPIKAILLYRQMIGSGRSPNEFTLPFVFKACATKLAYWESMLVHGQAIKLGIGSQVCVQNALINVYCVCGSIHCARQVFDDISDSTVVSWNSMIRGYSKTGCCEEAFLLFRKMIERGLEPDEFTLVSLLSVCAQTCYINFGRFVHLYIEITGMGIDLVVENALLDMYAKCGHLHFAQKVFDRMSDKNVVSWTCMVGAYAKHRLIGFARQLFNQMPVRNVVSWNSMISCYVQEGRCREALKLFNEMCYSGVMPDEATLLSILSACGQTGDLEMGKKTHGCIGSNNVIPSVALCNSLIDMYAKCGALAIAMDIFNKMPEKSLISWNVMVGALALHGCGLEAIKLFEKMQARGIQPDQITFTGLLSACSHSGLVEMGRYYFERMTSVYGVFHEIEHYACMIDLLGRVGLFEEAVRLMGEMPMKPDVVVWGALLGACRTHGNVEIGKQILKQVLELQPYCSGLYVLLSNLYCKAQRWKDMKNIRKLMMDQGIIKCRAISFVEIEGCVYEFMVDDKRHEISSGIYSIVDHLTDHLKYLAFVGNLSDFCADVKEI